MNFIEDVKLDCGNVREGHAVDYLRNGFDCVSTNDCRTVVIFSLRHECISRFGECLLG